MEQLLLILFLLFSVISALLERRKRRRQMEEEQRRQQQTGEGPPPVGAEQEKEEEEWGGWPFPGGDPFEPRPTPPPTAQREPDEGEVVVLESAAPADGQSLLEQLERQAQEAEQRARDEEERAHERAQEIQQSRQRMAARMREMERAGPAPSDRPRRRSPWSLTPERAREAVVYAEILGPCKADRGEEWRW
ncbi:MAG: hypothetical protein OXG13_06510 [Gemmatimonadaceae bacterium]|nr:hypothetical protein [Gemmatimonadaceae bacterium]